MPRTCPYFRLDRSPSLLPRCCETMVAVSKQTTFLGCQHDDGSQAIDRALVMLHSLGIEMAFWIDRGSSENIGDLQCGHRSRGEYNCQPRVALRVSRGVRECSSSSCCQDRDGQRQPTEQEGHPAEGRATTHRGAWSSPSWCRETQPHSPCPGRTEGGTRASAARASTSGAAGGKRTLTRNGETPTRWLAALAAIDADRGPLLIVLDGPRVAEDHREPYQAEIPREELGAHADGHPDPSCG